MRAAKDRARAGSPGRKQLETGSLLKILDLGGMQAVLDNNPFPL